MASGSPEAALQPGEGGPTSRSVRYNPLRMFRHHSSTPAFELGPLEVRVLELLWAGDGPRTVRDVHGAFPDLAYTTIMTTLDRLYRKRVLDRRLQGRAFAYRVRLSREELFAQLATARMVQLLPMQGSTRPILSMLVEAVGRRDVSLLDDLEALVKAERDRQRREHDA